MTERWEPRARQEPELLERCQAVLSRIGGKRRVDLPRTTGGLGLWPRLFLREGGALKYAFLLPVSEEEAELHVFPGDTLQQARVLFEDATRPDALLRLLSRGWQARPSFHFGDREAGYAWQNATASVDRYIDWCLAYVPRAETLRPHQWDEFLSRLESRGFASAGDRDRFHAVFANRKQAVPRPGLHLWKAIAAKLDDEEALFLEVRSELAQVLRAVKQSL